MLLSTAMSRSGAAVGRQPRAAAGAAVRGGRRAATAPRRCSAPAGPAGPCTSKGSRPRSRTAARPGRRPRPARRSARRRRCRRRSGRRRRPAPAGGGARSRAPASTASVVSRTGPYRAAARTSPRAADARRRCAAMVSAPRTRHRAATSSSDGGATDAARHLVPGRRASSPAAPRRPEPAEPAPAVASSDPPCTEPAASIPPERRGRRSADLRRPGRCACLPNGRALAGGCAAKAAADASAASRRRVPQLRTGSSAAPSAARTGRVRLDDLAVDADA